MQTVMRRTFALSFIYPFNSIFVEVSIQRGQLKLSNYYKSVLLMSHNKNMPKSTKH